MKHVTDYVVMGIGIMAFFAMDMVFADSLGDLKIFKVAPDNAAKFSVKKPTFLLKTAFSCGPGFKTYSVSFPNVDASSPYYSKGVRCVKFENYQVIGDNIAGIYWYAEGLWGKNTYRNIGYTLKARNPFGGADSVYLRSAAITGNGEMTGDYIQDTAKFREVDGQNVIEFEHVLKERWTLETDGKVDGYTGLSTKVENCGETLSKMKASSSNKTGSGIRCLLRGGHDSYESLPSLWYGEGEWGGKNYKHLGILNRKDSLDLNPLSATGIDICNRKGDFCSAAPMTGIKIKDTMTCGEPLAYSVSGVWDEKWKSDDSSYLNCPK